MSEEKIQQLEKRIAVIEERNKRVEGDKGWEISMTRKVIIFILTYIVVLLFMYLSGITQPFLNAFVTAVAFFLSTLTVTLLKNIWLRRNRK